MKFYKLVFGSCLGALLALIALGFILMTMMTGLASSFEKKSVKIQSNSVLNLDLSKPIPELTNNVKVQFSEFKMEEVIGLQDIIKSIERAKNDPKIKAIFMDIPTVGSALSATSDIHRALLDFKTSGKPVFAYANAYTQRSYALATAADSIILNPNGMIDMKGFGVTMAFLEEFLDNIGVDMQVFYVGDYKSATEPFRLKKMSDYNREQVKDYLSDLYDTHTKLITSQRGLSVQDIKALANDEVFVEPDKAVKYNLVDAVMYKDQVIDLIKGHLGMDMSKEIKYVDIGDYNTTKKVDYSIKDKVAIVYAEGDIVESDDDNGKITYNRYAKILKKLRKDKKVKAVVLRVNSPGGSALTSDNIWRETILLKESGKPFVVSFGNVAASGGYYISAAADQIFANENTITGSIGVFGMLPDASRLFEEKLKIHFDTVAVTENANAFTPFYKMNKKQYAILQESVEQVYNQFIRRVADGRNMDLKQVKEIARGRVYSGGRAKELGLVDEIGGLDAAIRRAAELANLEKYRTVSYPKLKSPFEQLMEDFVGGNAQALMADARIQEMLPIYESYKMIREMKGPQMRLPFVLLEE